MEFYSYLGKNLAKTGVARPLLPAMYNSILKGFTRLGFLVG